MTGLHNLITPTSVEHEAVQCLSSHLQTLSHHGNQLHGNSFLSETRDFLDKLLVVCATGCSETVHVPGWLPCLQSIILTVSETLYVMLSSLVCKTATDEAIVVTLRTKGQLAELLIRLVDVQKDVLIIQHGVVDLIGTKESRSAEYVHDSQKLTRQSQMVLDMLEGCHVLLAVVVEAVDKKCSFDVRFFNTASITVGAISVGRFAWSLWKGDAVEDVIHAGLWSTCMVFTSAILQVPRVRVTDVQSQLLKHREVQRKVKKMSAGWQNIQDWSYAKFVGIPLPRNGARL